MKKTTILTALLVLMAVFTAQSQTATAPAAGDGTSGNPYQIATLDNLYWLSQSDTAWDKNYIQTADINAAGTRNWNISGTDTLGFSPIGNNTTQFTGTYNGQGHIIDSLFINRSSEIIIGFFGYIGSSAELSYLGVTNIYITGNNYTGSIAGLSDGQINNVYSSGQIYSTSSVIGGLVGRAQSSGIINNSYSMVNVLGGSAVGGLVGSNINSSQIVNCYSIGVVAGSNTGGLVSYNAGVITNSFWDTQTSGQTTSAGGTGLTTAEMQTLTIYTDSTWDFVGETANGTNDYWDMSSCLNGGYPYLSWQTDLSFTTPTGSGTTADPYQIATLADLRWLSENSCVWDKNFIQTADINAAETHNWNISGSDTLGFSPIGNSTINFTGSYNGQGHIIDSLFIDGLFTHYIGLFGFANGVTIDSLGVINCDIRALNNLNTGSIVGGIYFSNLKNCYSTGYVTGANNTGGLIGKSQGTDITNCYSCVVVTSTSSYVGGFVGFVGYTSSTVTINNCYSTGQINTSSTTGIGGFIGGINGTETTITNSFWDAETSGLDTSAGGTGLTTAEMQQMCVYADSTWDFMIETVNGTNDIWGLNANENGGYPFLSWQGYTHTEECCGYVDLTNPTISCLPNQIVTAASNHYYTVVGNEFDPTSSNDNCGVASIVNNYNNTVSLDGELLPEGTTTITWIITDNSGNIDSCSFDVQVDNFVGINTISQNKTKIYPNPAHNFVVIQNSEFKIQSYEVLDITGKSIYCNSEHSEEFIQINISDLKTGVYFIKLTTNNTSEVLRFVKK